MLPLGLGFLSLSDCPGELNLFENLYQPVKRRSHTALKDGATLKRLAFLATAFIVVFCLAGYGVDWLKLNRLKAYNQTTDPNLNVNVRLEQERIRKVIATERPDLLDLLDKVNSVQTEGITLTSFSFKKGQHVSMNGFARDHGQLYKYQEGLLKQAGISSVEVQKAVRDEKKGQVAFSMIFDYRNFSKRPKPL
jgi:hypothetical protein